MTEKKCKHKFVHLRRVPLLGDSFYCEKCAEVRYRS